MKNIETLKEKYFSEIEDFFTDPLAVPNFSNLKEGLDLLFAFIAYDVSDKSLDGLKNSFFSSLEKCLISETGKPEPLKILATSLESFFKKVILVKDSQKSTDMMMPLMKRLNLSNDLSNQTGKNSYPQFTYQELPNYKGKKDYLYYLCHTYLTRNEIHNAPTWKLQETINAIHSVLVVYLYTILKYYNELHSKIDFSKIDNLTDAEKLNSVTLPILKTDRSLKLIQSDFGIEVNSIEEFQISLKAKAKKIEKDRSEYLKEAGKLNIIPVSWFPDINSIMSSNKKYLIHGEPTSGKSTFLKKIGLDFFKIRQEGDLIFYIELNQHFNKSSKKSLKDVMISYFSEVTKSTLDLKNKVTLVLLDGLDELDSDQTRDFVINEIKNNNEVNLKIVVSSRSNELNEYLKNSNYDIGSIFEVYELFPLSFEEMITIGSKIINENSQVKEFTKMLRKGNLMAAFPKTPLTTMIFAILFKEKKIDFKEMPRNITELYSKFTDMFLNKWDTNKGLSEQFKVPQKKFIVEKIAEFMHSNKKIVLNESELDTLLVKISKEHDIPEIASIDDFKKKICNRSNVIVNDAHDSTYRFFHLTMQEYFVSLKLNHKDENQLVENFYDDWWLNPNIFYAGKNEDHQDVLLRVSKRNEIFPHNVEDKINHIIHLSKVLQAAHLLSSSRKKEVLESMITTFDELYREMIKELVDSKDHRIANRTLLDIILAARDFFCEFFSSKQFVSHLEGILDNILDTDTQYLMDITEYCIAFSLFSTKQDAKYLTKFLYSPKREKMRNVRWYKIIEIDSLIKGIKFSDKKIKVKIKRKATKNKDYIIQQFTQKISKHYNSITKLS